MNKALFICKHSSDEYLCYELDNNHEAHLCGDFWKPTQGMWFVSHDRNSSVCLICIPDCVLTFRVCLSSRGHACEWPHGNNDHSLVFDLQWLPPSSKLGVETLPVDLVLIHNNGHSPFIFLCCVIVSVFVYLYLLYFGVHFNFSPLSWMIACNTTVELSKARVFKVLVFWK